MKTAHRVDANQKEIVRALRRCGVSVLDLSAVGGGCPDILAGFGGYDVLLELKTEDGALSDGQKKFHNSWNGTPVQVVRSKDEALKAVGAFRDWKVKRKRTICPECGESPRHCACAQKRAVAKELIPTGEYGESAA